MKISQAVRVIANERGHDFAIGEIVYRTAANGVERTKKLPLSGRRRAVAWKRFDHGVPLRKAEASYLESAYLEEWAAEMGPY